MIERRRSRRHWCESPGGGSSFVLHIHAQICIFLRMRVGIAGASGYAGAELLRLCAGHPDLEVVVAGADTQAGQPVAALYPSLAAAYPTLEFSKVGAERPRRARRGVPGASPRRVPGAGPRARRTGSGSSWTCPPTSGCATRRPTRGGTATTMSPPTCWPSSSTGSRSCSGPSWPGPGWWPRRGATRPRRRWRWRRSCAPGSIETTGVIVDAASGVSGAGRKLSHTTHFNTADEDFTAYGLLNHRHTPEIEQASGAQVLFTPHLAPMNRGILATCYARARRRRCTPMTSSGSCATPTRGEPFVVVSEASPSTKATLGIELRPPDGARRPPHRLGAVAVRARQPREGRVGPGRAVRQHRPRACPRPRGSRPSGCTRERHRPGGFVARRAWRAGSRRRVLPTWPWWRRPAGAVPAAGRVHRQPGRGGAGAGEPGPSGRDRRARRGRRALERERQRGDGRARAWPAAQRMCALVGEGLGVRADEVLVCQTGLIGIPFPLAPGRDRDPGARRGARRRTATAPGGPRRPS